MANKKMKTLTIGENTYEIVDEQARIDLEQAKTDLEQAKIDLVELESSLATVATSGSYNDLSDKPAIPNPVTVDDAIASGGANPVTGDAIYTALNNKADKNHTQSASTLVLEH